MQITKEACSTTGDKLIGCLLGTAVGDSIGLPYEGLSRRRRAKLFGPPDRQRFFFRRGMVSDDTEHACLTAQSLMDSQGDIGRFERAMCGRLGWWLLGMPAGAGRATIKSVAKLWLGFGPRRSGVFSAGNGPAMRAAILGAAVDDPDQLQELVRVSTRITHTDPKAEFGALAVAWAARQCRCPELDSRLYLEELRQRLGPDGGELIDLLHSAIESVDRGETTIQFADTLGLARGVSGYMYHTVPVAIHAWLRSPDDLRAAIISVIECGGDTDTAAAIVGGIVGTRVGKQGIPSDWLDTLWEWPRTVRWMERLGEQLGSYPTNNGPALRLPPFGLLPRNILFLTIVLVHGFRRLLPPY